MMPTSITATSPEPTTPIGGRAMVLEIDPAEHDRRSDLAEHHVKGSFLDHPLAMTGVRG